MTLELIIIGLGKRVTGCALPAIAAAGEEVRVRGIFARTERSEEIGGTTVKVRALESLTAADLASNPTVYLCVPKTEIPGVLRQLAALDPSAADLFIDTPVVRLKDFRHAGLLDCWRKVSVAEDCARMPWVELLLAAQGEPLGKLKEVVFEHSAYAYHGVATARALAEGSEVVSARRHKNPAGSVRLLDYMNGFSCEIVDPRDYSQGRILARYENNLVSDQPAAGESALAVEISLDGEGAITALRLGETEVILDDGERSLTLGDHPDATLIARQEAMKRVGFLRLLRELARGQAGYPLWDGLEDMVVDHSLERLGRYRSSYFTSPRHRTARWVYGLVSRIAGG
mgnify:FL=1|jgi:hypothetical protein